MDPILNSLNLKLEHPAAQSHANHAERNIRHLEERVRCAWHSTPVLLLPKQAIIQLVLDVTAKLDLFPAKQGISQMYSPRQILTGKVLDYKHLLYTFGSFCLAHDRPEPSNNNEPRGLECLYMRPILDNSTGGHIFLDLHSWRLITRQHLTVLPMPDRVIEIVHAKAKKEGMKPF